MSQVKSLSSMLPLFLVLLIDGMGLGLLFPILNTILIEPTSGFFPVETSLGIRDFCYGITIGSFMICWFFGAAILGDLSDSVGRKKITDDLLNWGLFRVYLVRGCYHFP